MISEDDKIFVRYPSQKEEEIERWYVLDTKEEIEQLLLALNTKGIKEKSLHDNINFHLKNSFLNMISDAERKANESNDTAAGGDKLSEILTSLISSQNTNEIKPNTRGRPKKTPQTIKKNILSYEMIQDSLFKIEIYFNDYLNQRSSRWILEEKREKTVNTHYILVLLKKF